MTLYDLVNSKIYKGSLYDISLQQSCVITTINPHSYCIAKKDAVFNNALLSSDVLLPDGFGIVLAVKILTGQKIKSKLGIIFIWEETLKLNVM
tara:strand:- start:419 stop:697 length:279 start_codon:yes stop_codon:yes gene_type:complete